MSVITIIVVGCIIGICVTLLGLIALTKVAERHNLRLKNTEVKSTQPDFKFTLFLISGGICWLWLIIYAVVLINQVFYSSNQEVAVALVLYVFYPIGFDVTIFVVVFSIILVGATRLIRRKI